MMIQCTSIEKCYALSIKSILHNCLEQLGIPFHIPEFNHKFYEACCAGAISRGFALDGPVTIKPYIPLGVYMATTSYADLENTETRIFIALYTAALVAVEDVCGDEFELLRAFCHKFVIGQPHGHPILDCFDFFLRELPVHYELVVSDMMLHSSLDFIVANVLEYEMRTTELSPSARSFPIFLRNLSGASKIYSLMAFPREVPLRSYFQTIPAMMTYVNYLNDIFSFYKEELVEETTNCISNMARCGKKSRLQVLQELCEDSVDAHREILAVLARSPVAMKMYKGFAKGYVYFHTSCPRYKLSHLFSPVDRK
ncbi:hypothetical protein AMATHDRAFT_180831 [Amanita thiersii Skay4041]|uniref:Terpene synthase n=1 Tax=Amanita thiersii Skay4041 TaxID=703135 RepID=A0A2A9NKL6_9AGAR|nr:hypothetical protein AMATHDRAFT_180831 [Amanita thiersii Skay4041]